MSRSDDRSWPRVTMFGWISVAALVGCPAAKTTVEHPAARPPTTRPPRDGSVGVGSRVRAPWGRCGAMHWGRVSELYGKLGKIELDNGDVGWALLARLRPAGLPKVVLGVVGCTFRPGQRVKARWSSRPKLHPGRVVDTYGMLMQVDFDHGGRGWTACKAATVIDEKTPRAASVGERVKTEWSRDPRLYSGKIAQIYGKLALVKLDDGDQAWVLLTLLRPPFSPAAAPDDKCRLFLGQAVDAPWSSEKEMHQGVVVDTYGKLAAIDFKDGDRGWVLCSEARPRSSKEAATAASAPAG